MNGWRGVIGGALTLIVLQAFLSGKGPEAGGQMLVWVSGAFEKLMSSKVGAIPTAKKTAPAKQDSKAPAQAGGVSGPLGLGTNPTVTV